jgi:broad specificity phosphatase PhoE
MTRVILIRHPQTTNDLYLPISQDHVDAGLTEAGRQAAAALKLRLASEPETGRIFVSPLMRARETAQTLYPGKAIEIIDGFREIDKGFPAWIAAHPDHADLTTKQWEDQFNAGANLPNKLQFPYPSGVTVSSFMKSVWKIFLETVEDCHADTIAIIRHNGPIKSILSMSQNDTAQYYRHSIKYASYSVIERSGGKWRIIGMNK